MLQSENPKPAHRKTGVMLAVCVMSLLGCAATSPTCPSVSAVLPVMPSISTPLPQTSYSISARDDIAKWRQQLKATRLMSKP